jgi:recombination protein RecA
MAGPRKKEAVEEKACTESFLTEMVDTLISKAGEGTAQLLGSDGMAIKIRGVLSTQCPTIDAAIGRGGVPLGRLTIIHGSEGSGKTTLALHLVAECQRQGGLAIYIDKEYKLDPDYAKGIGVDISQLIISQPPYLEKCMAIMDEAIHRVAMHRVETGVRVPLLIILDSMNAAISKDMYSGDWEDQTMASVARVYSQKLPKLMEKVSQEDVALVFISQVREKVGIMFGNKEEICGGRAPKFHASLILEVIRKGSMKGESEGEEKKDEGGEKKKGKKDKDVEIIGNLNEVFVRKNQIAPPFKRAEFEVIYGKGIDFSGALIRRAQALGVLEKHGNIYATQEGERVGNGFAAAREALVANEGLRGLIAERVRCASSWYSGAKS